MPDMDPMGYAIGGAEEQGWCIYFPILNEELIKEPQESEKKNHRVADWSKELSFGTLGVFSSPKFNGKTEPESRFFMVFFKFGIFKLPGVDFLRWAMLIFQGVTVSNEKGFHHHQLMLRWW